jgi:hypothetical protein
MHYEHALLAADAAQILDYAGWAELTIRSGIGHPVFMKKPLAHKTSLASTLRV